MTYLPERQPLVIILVLKHSSQEYTI